MLGVHLALLVTMVTSRVLQNVLHALISNTRTRKVGYTYNLFHGFTVHTMHRYLKYLLELTIIKVNAFCDGMQSIDKVKIEKQWVVSFRYRVTKLQSGQN